MGRRLLLAGAVITVLAWVLSIQYQPHDTSTSDEHESPHPTFQRPVVITSSPQRAVTSAERELAPPVALVPALDEPVPAKACNEKLYTPTYITYIQQLHQYVLVDCWHHRTILSPRLDASIAEWSDLRDLVDVEKNSPQQRGSSRSLMSLKIPHSVATDGNILVMESSVGGSNGDNHSLLVFRFAKTPHGSGRNNTNIALEFIQEVHACDGNRARRPHRVIYDSFTNSFYLYLTSPAHLSRFVWNPVAQMLDRVSCQGLPFMKGMYARSIVALNGSLYITAGPGVITRCVLHRDSGLIVKQQSYSTKFLGFAKGKMNDLAFYDGWWYATSTVPCAMVRFRDVNRLWEHEKIHSTLGLCATFSRRQSRCLGGTPYFVSKIGDRIYVPYIFGCSGVVSFRVDETSGAITDIVQHWGSGWVEDDSDLQCRGPEW